MIVHNCPHIENLSYLQNITSVGKAMDRGVIRYLKSHYRKRLVNLILRNLEHNKSLLNPFHATGLFLYALEI